MPIETLPLIQVPKIGNDEINEIDESQNESSKLVLLNNDEIAFETIVSVIRKLLGYSMEKTLEIVTHCHFFGEAIMAKGDYDKMINLAMDFASHKCYIVNPNGVSINVRVDE